MVALGKPTEREESEWYFQRYVHHLPAAGEMVLFDRSWYNRAGVERVMGFAPMSSTSGSSTRRPRSSGCSSTTACFRATDTDSAPWTVVKSNDKKLARTEAMRCVLARFDYPDKDPDIVGEPDPRIVGAAPTLLEPGEDDTSLSPTPIAAKPTDAVLGPGHHPTT